MATPQNGSPKEKMAAAFTRVLKYDDCVEESKTQASQNVLMPRETADSKKQ